MSTNIALAQFHNEIQQIVEIVNTQLIDGGHQDLTIEAGDFQLEPSSIPNPASDLQLKFTLGPDLHVNVAPIYLLDSPHQLESFANDLTKALVNLNQARKFLIRYHRSVRAAANRAVRSARGSGYRIKLVEVALKRTYAFHLTYTKWREAVSHVLATIDLEILRAKGEPDEHYLVIEEPQDVAHEVENVLPD